MDVQLLASLQKSLKSIRFFFNIKWVICQQESWLYQQRLILAELYWLVKETKRGKTFMKSQDSTLMDPRVQSKP